MCFSHQKTAPFVVCSHITKSFPLITSSRILRLGGQCAQVVLGLWTDLLVGPVAEYSLCWEWMALITLCITFSFWFVLFRYTETHTMFWGTSYSQTCKINVTPWHREKVVPQKGAAPPPSLPVYCDAHNVAILVFSKKKGTYVKQSFIQQRSREQSTL